MTVNSIDDLKTDARIGDILKKLQSVNSKTSKTKTNSSNVSDSTPLNNKDDNNSDEIGDTKEEPSLISSAIASGIIKEPEVTHIGKDEEKDIHETLVDRKFVSESILPWFNESDRDTSKFHYIIMNSSGNLEHCSIDANIPSSDIAAIKLKSDYLCDIDYYNSRHYVLCVEVLSSSYSLSNQSSNLYNSSTVNQSSSNFDEFVKCIIFTDLGIAEFITKRDDISYPCVGNDFNSWFEEVSNNVIVRDAVYKPNCNDKLSATVSSIGDDKYDLFTMHRPGIITLDSLDSDSNSVIHIKLKDEFDFLPMSRVLGCLKLYSDSSEKTSDEFKHFINKYFDVIV